MLTNLHANPYAHSVSLSNVGSALYTDKPSSLQARGTIFGAGQRSKLIVFRILIAERALHREFFDKSGRGRAGHRLPVGVVEARPFGRGQRPGAKRGAKPDPAGGHHAKLRRCGG